MPPSETAASPDWLLELLACPRCHVGVKLAGESYACDRCGERYPTGKHGQPDLRLTAPLALDLPLTYDPSRVDIPESLWELPPNVAALAKEGSKGYGRPQDDLVAWIRSLVRPGSVVLDLGAMSNRDKQMIEGLGGRYIGIEITDSQAMVLGDAHAIPLKDGSVDVVMSMSVFEHLKNPFIAAQEVRRILKPGGWFIGIVGFLEPIHGLPHGSYYHHSYLGMHNLLKVSGFVVRYLGVLRGWQGIHALSRGMLPGVPKRIAYLTIRPLQAMQSLLYRLAPKSAAASTAQRYRTLSASVHFVAQTTEKPGASDPAL